MALLQIVEQNQDQVKYKNKLAIGIDLGTTNSMVASVVNNTNIILTDKDNNATLPSVIHCGKDKITVGKDSYSYMSLDPTNTITSVKRFVGRSYQEISQAKNLPYKIKAQDNNNILFKTQAGDFSIVELLSIILSSLKKRAEKYFGDEVNLAVITVPAYFNDSQRQATKDAAILAGLKVMRLLNEPTAAAVAYGLETDKEGIHVVYDLGGGTFDISVLNFTKGVFKVLATGGDSTLGGDDFDQLIIDDCINSFKLKNLTAEDIQTIKQLSRKAKEDLSNNKLLAFSTR
jgi:molecular chaperone HscA